MRRFRVEFTIMPGIDNSRGHTGTPFGDFCHGNQMNMFAGRKSQCYEVGIKRSKK
jgi:hypothetical protein